MQSLKSTNLQLIGFFGMKKPITCKIVDSVHSSVNFILETVPNFIDFSRGLVYAMVQWIHLHITLSLIYNYFKSVWQVIANETKEVVEKEERGAVKKAEETQAIADDAQRDLNEAIPALVRIIFEIFEIIAFEMKGNEIVVRICEIRIDMICTNL